MGMVDASLIGFGLALHALFLWRCQKESHWSRYPFFFSYVAFTFLRTVVLLILREVDHPLYPWLYWSTNFGAVVLRFAVAWEVFRHLFLPRTVIREIAGRILVVLLVSLTTVFYFLSSPAGTFLDFERKVGLAVVTCLVVTLLLAPFYRVSVGKNIWGMAVGMGLFVSISIANFATFDLISSFLPFWTLLTPVSFLTMMLIWTWTLWSYAPEPHQATLGGLTPQAALTRWNRVWNDFGPTIRRSIGL